MKKEYTKPTQQTVVLQFQQQLLLNTSITKTATNLSDDISISEKEAGEGFWGR